MYHLSLPLGLLFWCFLLLLHFVIGDFYTPPDIICKFGSLPSDFNPKDCEHILSTFPALHLDVAKQVPGGDRPTLFLPLRATPYRLPAQFTYKTCRVELAAFGMFKRQFSGHPAAPDLSKNEVLGHVHRRGQTVSRMAAPLTDEQKAFYLWPEVKDMGAAVMKKCLGERGTLGEARGRFQVPEMGTVTRRVGGSSSSIKTSRSIFCNIKLEPTSTEIDEKYLWPHYFSRLGAGDPHVYDLNPDVFYTPPGSPSHGQSSTSPLNSAH